MVDGSMQDGVGGNNYSQKEDQLVTTLIREPVVEIFKNSSICTGFN
jgi:hypothetical protein